MPSCPFCPSDDRGCRKYAISLWTDLHPVILFLVTDTQWKAWFGTIYSINGSGTINRVNDDDISYDFFLILVMINKEI